MTLAKILRKRLYKVWYKRSMSVSESEYYEMFDLVSALLYGLKKGS